MPNGHFWQTTSGRLTVLGVLVGAVLGIIGIRFLLVPEAARFTFGLPDESGLAELAAVIAFRDLWLGLLAIVFAVLKDWRALGVWLALGAVVCVADAALVAVSGGPAAAIAFHTGSGLLCAGLAVRCWQLYTRASARL